MKHKDVTQLPRQNGSTPQNASCDLGERCHSRRGIFIVLLCGMMLTIACENAIGGNFSITNITPNGDDIELEILYTTSFRTNYTELNIFSTVDLVNPDWVREAIVQVDTGATSVTWTHVDATEVSRGYACGNNDFDTDGDRMSDDWESVNGLDKDDASDGTEDADNDSFLNVYEYIHNTDPQDASSEPSGTHFVADTGSHTSPFDTWAKAATNIQSALDVATDAYDIVLVEEGTYQGPLNKNLTFPANAIMLSSRDSSTNCVIDCQNNGRGLVFDNYHERTTVINAIGITRGLTDRGGGIFCTNASPSIVACRVWDSTATEYGGGMYFRLSSARIADSTVEANTANLDGGGIDFDLANIDIENCFVVDNSSVTNEGAGITAWNSIATLRNCTVAGNSQTAGDGAGIVFGGTYSTGLVQNCIVWTNSPTQLSNLSSNGLLTVTYSDVQYGFTGTGNISDFPAFTSGYKISSTSPCIDAGTNNLLLVDFEGDARFDDTSATNAVAIWDIGADEYTP